MKRQPYEDIYFDSFCKEKHTGNTPRSIMTKGTSTRRKNRLPGRLYGNFDPGDQDKLMITYQRDPEHDYSLYGACGVVYQGDIHFFGGVYKKNSSEFIDPISHFVTEYDFRRQHFFIATQRKGRMVKMTKMKNLNVGFYFPSCSNFEITSDNFPWSSKNIVILCFTPDKAKSCYSFDGEISFIGESLYSHSGPNNAGPGGGLAKYRGKLITAGGGYIMKIEIMERKKNGTYIWSESDAKFSQYKGGPFITANLVVVTKKT